MYSPEASIVSSRVGKERGEKELLKNDPTLFLYQWEASIVSSQAVRSER